MLGWIHNFLVLVHGPSPGPFLSFVGILFIKSEKVVIIERNVVFQSAGDQVFPLCSRGELVIFSDVSSESGQFVGVS